MNSLHPHDELWARTFIADYRDQFPYGRWNSSDMLHRIALNQSADIWLLGWDRRQQLANAKFLQNKPSTNKK